MTVVETMNRRVRQVPAWSIYVVSVVPPVWLFWLGLTGGLGVEPIKALEHELGLLGLQVLIAGLAITPLRRFAGLNLLKFRRAIGVVAFVYIALHLLVWLVLDIQDLSRVWADILKRPYITIGMAGFLLLIPLALTSNNLSVRKLGPKWRRLHWLVYPAVLLGALHFVMLVKGFQIEPLIYLGAVAGLLAMRMRRTRRRQTA